MPENSMSVEEFLANVKQIPQNEGQINTALALVLALTVSALDINDAVTKIRGVSATAAQLNAAGSSAANLDYFAAAGRSLKTILPNADDAWIQGIVTASQIGRYLSSSGITDAHILSWQALTFFRALQVTSSQLNAAGQFVRALDYNAPEVNDLLRRVESGALGAQGGGGESLEGLQVSTADINMAVAYILADHGCTSFFDIYAYMTWPDDPDKPGEYPEAYVKVTATQGDTLLMGYTDGNGRVRLPILSLGEWEIDAKIFGNDWPGIVETVVVEDDRPSYSVNLNFPNYQIPLWPEPVTPLPYEPPEEGDEGEGTP